MSVGSVVQKSYMLRLFSYRRDDKEPLQRRQYSVANLSDTWWTTLYTIFVSLQCCSCMIGTKSELLFLLFYRWYCKEMCYRYLRNLAISHLTSLILSQLLCRHIFVKIKQHSWWLDQSLIGYGSFPTGEIITNCCKEDNILWPTCQILGEPHCEQYLYHCNTVVMWLELSLNYCCSFSTGDTVKNVLQIGDPLRNRAMERLYPVQQVWYSVSYCVDVYL